MQRLFGGMRSIAFTLSTKRNEAKKWWTTAFSTSLLFDHTQVLFKESIARFAEEKIAPYAPKLDKMNVFPKEVNLWKLMGDFHLHGITAPEEYGGLGLGHIYHCIAMEEISRVSGSIGLSYGAHTNLCINQLVRNGTAAQKEKYLPKLIRGEHVGAVAMREPGPDAINMKCKADRVDGGYILNGNKVWCTNGPTAQTLVVYAKTNVTPLSNEITSFIIEKGMPGFSAAQKTDKLMMRGSDKYKLIFKDCFIPQENVLGVEGKGIDVMKSGLDLERLVSAAGPIGIMQACLEEVFPYFHEREDFSRQNGELNLKQRKIADIYTTLQSSRSYVYIVARNCDKGKIVSKDCVGAMLCTAERATQVILQAIQCQSGNGYVNGYPTSRFLHDAKLYKQDWGWNE